MANAIAALSLTANCIAATALIPLRTRAAAVPENMSFAPVCPDAQEFSTTSRGVGCASHSRSASRAGLDQVDLAVRPVRAITPSPVPLS